MIHVTFTADKATEDRFECSPALCSSAQYHPEILDPARWTWPAALAYAATHHLAAGCARGRTVRVWRLTSGKGEQLAGQWAECHVESHEEQIARLTAEKDAAAVRVTHLEAQNGVRARKVDELRGLLADECARANAATTWGSRSTEALRLTTRALSLACSPIEDDVAREVLIRAICAAKEALEKAQPAMTLDVAGVCSRLVRGGAAEKRLADLRAWAVEIAEGQSDSKEGRRVAGDFRAVVYRIDGEDGESK